jgi:hypothetical protein
MDIELTLIAFTTIGVIAGLLAGYIAWGAK